MLKPQGENKLKSIIYKLLIMSAVIGLLISSMIYLNNRWDKIRDIRRQGDLQSITKALNFYYYQYDKYPGTSDDDGDGWDKSSDKGDYSFLDPLIEVGLLSARPFDPKNNEEYYYRYQKFEQGDFGCNRDYAIFQITQFETEVQKHGSGSCPEIEWTELAPGGYTWQGME